MRFASLNPDASLGADQRTETGCLVYWNCQKIYRPDIYMAAAKALIAEGKAKAGDFPR